MLRKSAIALFVLLKLLLLGGYENDVSLIRLAENHFFMIAPTEQQARCYSWLRSNLHADSNVSIQNVSADYTAICIMGPYSKVRRQNVF